MRIELAKFGEFLISRPDGRKAFSTMLVQATNENELIEVDFMGVKVITPGWADEVVTKLAQKFKNVKLLNTDNVTVQATLKTLREYSDLKI